MDKELAVVLIESCCERRIVDRVVLNLVIDLCRRRLLGYDLSTLFEITPHVSVAEQWLDDS